MSLINQMLRDLEQRSPTPSQTTTPQPLKIQQVALPDRATNHNVLWWLFLLPICLSVAGMFYYQPGILNPAISSAPHPVEPAETKIAPTIIQQPLTSIPKEAQAIIENNSPPKTSQLQPTSAPIDSKPSPPKPSPIAKAPDKKPPFNRQKPAAVANLTPADHGLSADALYRQAAALPAGNQRKAILQETLTINPKHLAARTLLLQTLQQTNASLELKPFLDQSLEIFPGHPGFTTALAHWQIKQKQADAAISTLESIDSRQQHDPNFLALKAAGYQQQQQYTRALPLYLELTHIQPDKAEHWLGLGVCADKLKQSGLALQAYQQAFNKNTLHGDVLDYIKQRLSALTY